MTEIIGFCNQKGGVGKTTTAINLAASLATAEKRILIIDLDPQGNTTTGLGFDKSLINTSSYNMITGEGKAIIPEQTMLPFLELIPSNSELAGAELELAEMEGREKRVRDSVNLFRGKYDFILIDGPPSLGLLTVNLLTAADQVLIPVQCEYYALEGLSDLLRTIELVKANLNRSLSVCGILLTMFDGRNNLAREVEKEIRDHFQETVFKTVIPRSVRLSEAPSYGKPVMLHDIKSRGAQSYLQLAKEFLERFSARQKREVETLARSA